MRTQKQQREFFIRHLTGIVKSAIDAVERDLGHVQPDEVARRIAKTLWFRNSPKGHRTYADWVKYVRRSADMTQEKFAKALDVSQVTVARWESGKVLPSKPHQKLITSIGARHMVYIDDTPERVLASLTL